MVSLGTYIFANFIFIYARHVVIKGRKQRHAKYDIVAYYVLLLLMYCITWQGEKHECGTCVYATGCGPTSK